MYLEHERGAADQHAGAEVLGDAGQLHNTTRHLYMLPRNVSSPVLGLEAKIYEMNQG